MSIDPPTGPSDGRAVPEDDAMAGRPDGRRRVASAAPADGHGVVISAILVAAVIAAANWAFWSRLNRPPVSAPWVGPVGGFAYNGFRRDQTPLPPNPTYPTEEEVGDDIAMLSKYSNRLRIYSTLDAPSAPAQARDHGMNGDGRRVAVDRQGQATTSRSRA